MSTSSYVIQRILCYRPQVIRFSFICHWHWLMRRRYTQRYCRIIIKRQELIRKCSRSLSWRHGKVSCCCGKSGPKAGFLTLAVGFLPLVEKRSLEVSTDASSARVSFSHGAHSLFWRTWCAPARKNYTFMKIALQKPGNLRQ